jgi:hypothetical protein
MIGVTAVKAREQRGGQREAKGSKGEAKGRPKGGQREAKGRWKGRQGGKRRRQEGKIREKTYFGIEGGRPEDFLLREGFMEKGRGLHSF